MNFRKAKLGDAIEISTIRCDNFRNLHQDKKSGEELRILLEKNTPQKIAEKIAQKEMFCLVNGEILGTVDLNKDEIGGVFVRYDLVRKGFGTKLMNFIEEYSKKKGIKKVWLRSSKNAQDFYKKRGYLFVKEIGYPEGGINFVMEKELS